MSDGIQRCDLRKPQRRDIPGQTAPSRHFRLVGMGPCDNRIDLVIIGRCPKREILPLPRARIGASQRINVAKNVLATNPIASAEIRVGAQNSIF